MSDPGDPNGGPAKDSAAATASVDRIAASLAELTELFRKANPPPPDTRLERLHEWLSWVARYIGIPALLIGALLPLWRYCASTSSAWRQSRVTSARTEYARDLLRARDYAGAERVLEGLGQDEQEGTFQDRQEAFLVADRAILDGAGVDSPIDRLEVIRRVSRGDDRCRAAIRLARLYLAKTDAAHARDVLAGVGAGDARSPSDAASYWYALGTTSRLLGSYKDARQHFERGIEAAQKDVGAQLEGKLLLAMMLFDCPDSSDDRRRARELCEEVMDCGDSRTGVRAQVSLARMDLHAGDYPRAERRLRDALIRAEATTDEGARAESLLYLGIIRGRVALQERAREEKAGAGSATWRRRLDEGLELYRRCEVISRRAHADLTLLTLLEVRAQLLRDCARLEEARADALELLTMVDQWQYPWFAARAHLVAGSIAYETYRRDPTAPSAIDERRTAGAEYDQSLAVAERGGDRKGQLYVLVRRGPFRLETGDSTGGAEDLKRAWELAGDDGGMLDRVAELADKHGVTLPARTKTAPKTPAPGRSDGS